MYIKCDRIYTDEPKYYDQGYVARMRVADSH